MKFLQFDLRSRFSQATMRESLLMLLHEKSLEKISVTDLCKYAHINRGTFYRYYSSVAELYDRIEDELVSGLFSAIRLDPAHLTADSYRAVLTAIRDDSEISTFVCGSAGNSKFAEKVICYLHQSVMDHWHSAHPDASDTQLEYTFLFLAGGTVRVVSYWIEQGFPDHVDTISERLARLVRYPD